MSYIPNDKWAQKAAAEGYRARSVYKLEELDAKFKLLNNGMKVLDLGAAPGSWLQYTAKKIGTTGKAIGIDLQDIAPIAENVLTVQADITDIPTVRHILEENGMKHADLVLSDLAPSTSGIKDIDQWKSIELSEAVLETAKHALKHNGICVLKILRGADFDEFLMNARKTWELIKIAQVRATRDSSSEVYVVVRKN